MVNLLVGIIAYSFQPKNPSIKISISMRCVIELANNVVSSREEYRTY
ncbi:hypothetical protein BTN49_1736 [Candidatus Enterovibrio escicola]|uniref:Uncharacterized protein n=1 Tax=Candidatus Enterovibrio escicola TaxID=1927127 RepID=A0A2A5T3P2_9GAMM|nr:hypothetical protein [Candidatus Enterovibrio escacola]PCS22772.1 hypothetical protein BTN49_1736 [Candidatus Enterovibrio escacola]